MSNTKFCQSRFKCLANSQGEIQNQLGGKELFKWVAIQSAHIFTNVGMACTLHTLFFVTPKS